jgi:hypothetical protein
MSWREILLKGAVIPAHPLALTAQRKLDERRQRALTRYYLAAGAGGVAIGVHTTQFAIRDPKVGLYQPLLELTMEELRGRDCVKVAGAVGPTAQAVREAEFAARCGYDAVLLSLGALREASVAELLDHVRAVASVLPVFGFYLQPAVGGRLLPYAFWRRFVEIENVVAIKIAPFNRYQTLDVVRAVAESGRAGQIALYTGNDDNHPRRPADRVPLRRRAELPHRWRIAGPLGLLDAARGRAPGARHRGRRRPRTPDRRAAHAGRPDHRRQRRPVRRRPPFPRLHRGHSRSLAAPGSDGRPLVPGSRRGPFPGPDGGD